MNLKATRAAARAAKQVDAKINRIYMQHCAGIPIRLSDIRKVFEVGRQSIAAGDDDATLTRKLKEFVESVRVI
jgi:hypothetical protein